MRVDKADYPDSQRPRRDAPSDAACIGASLRLRGILPTAACVAPLRALSRKARARTVKNP